MSQTIVYSSDGSDIELFAAKEVRRYIYVRTDSLLSIQGVSSLPENGDLILVARDDNLMVDSLRSLINHTANPGSFILKTVTTGGRQVLVIAGYDSIATLYGAYRYAEHLGVGFGLAGDVIPDAKITLDISDLDEVGDPLFETRGILPHYDFPEDPDLWNTDDYLAVISQLPKLGMNFIGIHTYTTYNSLWDYDNDYKRGPEPSVWIGLPQDVNSNGRVSWSYPAYYAHTKRPNYIWGFDTWDTDQFHGGASQLFPTNGYGSDVIGETPPTDVASSNAVFNRVGELFNKAFTYARSIGVKTAMGTELPLGIEVDGSDSWVRGVPPELQTRLTGMGKDPGDPAVVKDLYKGIFGRIMKTHPLDYYWLWSYEIWSSEGVTSTEIQALKNDIDLAQQALAELGNPFQIGHAGWKLGTVDPLNPAEFEDVFPIEAPFFSLWGSATGFESISSERVKWPASWMEYDWGLEQPQLGIYAVHEDAEAAWNKNCDGLIAAHWRTRIINPNIGALKDLHWAYGPTGLPITKSIPTNRWNWVDDYYLDWATHQFGSEVASSIANIFADLDGWGALPHALDWTEEMTGSFYMAPGAILPNSSNWSSEQSKYSFVDNLEALRPQIVGAGNLERFDYWLKAMQCLKIMGEYGCIRDDFESACEAGNWSTALNHRISMANLWEQLITLMVEKTTNASDLGEIINLEIINWKQLMMNKWDARMEAGLGESLPTEANPSMFYTGNPVVKVTPARTQIYIGEPLNLTVLIMENPTSATLNYRSLGEGSYQSKSLSHQARGVYEVTIPAQSDDFEYYIEVETPIGNVNFPVTAPEINQTVVVGPGVFIAGIQSDNVLQKFTLYQNYPNPFNPTTIIKYNLPQASNVKLSIYDILGKEVVRLVDERQGAEFSKVRWDGRNKYGNKVASGLYIYQIIARGFQKDQIFTQTRKMVIIK